MVRKKQGVNSWDSTHQQECIWFSVECVLMSDYDLNAVSEVGQNCESSIFWYENGQTEIQLIFGTEKSI